MLHESGSEVDPEYYEIELARDSKSISDSAFKLIYEQVWRKWYQPLCQEQGYWDDQDLAQAVLAYSANRLPCYPAVFCDEAQDFTSIELELIERLSLYSDRNIPSYLAKHVPFAFAGDPFQTLNPTGFNWNAMQSSFHDNIVQQLDDTGSAKLEFNFQELSFNYRSSEHIVKLANLIQLLRAVLLSIKGLRPQHSWTRKTTVSPVCFRRDDASCQSAIREQEELVIIVPCQENGELEYVKSDPFLSSIALNDNQISRNILSPARAKGLEYDRVLLYGFGDEARKRCPELLRHIAEPNREPPEIERRLAWEYFLNQFYVAVSRARKRLFIVDSGDSLNGFWVFTKPKKQFDLVGLYQSNTEWKPEDLCGIIQGDESSWSDDRDDPLELAERWESEGRAQRDPFLLNLAKSNYERAGRPEKAQLCEAAAYEFSEDFTEAGDLFKSLRQSDDACRCYWAGKNAVAVTNLVQEFPEIANDPRYLAASLITRDKNTAIQIDNLLRALERVKPASFPESSGEAAAWRWFFEKFITKVNLAIESSEQEQSDWRPSVDQITATMGRLGISRKAYPGLTKLYYLVGDLKTALAHWAESSSDRKQEPDWLIRARAKTEPYPANISYFERLNDFNTVIAAWREAGGNISSETPVNALLKSAGQIQDVAAISVLLPACNDITRVMEVIQAIDDKTMQQLGGAIVVAINQCLEGRGDWAEIVSFANTQKLSGMVVDARLKALLIKLPRSVFIAAAVRVLARSDRLAGESAKSQQIVSEFLKQHLVIDNSSKKEKLIKEIHSLVEMAEVGAAFERAFRLVFALEYYEQWFLKGGGAKRLLSPSGEDVSLAKRRWLICKYRLGVTQEGGRGDQHRDEAKKMEREWNLSVDREPEYPELGSVSGLNIPPTNEEQSIAPAQPETDTKEALTHARGSLETEHAVPRISMTVQLSVDDLNLAAKVLMRKQRVVLTHIETEDQVVCGPSKVSSEDVSIEQVKDEPPAKTWLIEDWKIFCEIQVCEGGSIIRLRTKRGHPIIGFELTMPA